MFASKLRTLSRLPGNLVNPSKVLRCEVVSFNTTPVFQNMSNTLPDISQLPVQYGVDRQVWVENLDSG